MRRNIAYRDFVDEREQALNVMSWNADYCFNVIYVPTGWPHSAAKQRTEHSLAGLPIDRPGKRVCLSEGDRVLPSYLWIINECGK